MPSILTNCALTTWATIKTELGLADADQTNAERLINVASTAIEGYCGRHFDKATVTSEIYVATGMQRLILERTPIVSISSITDDGTAIAASDYAIEDAALGFVWSDVGWATEDEIILGSVSRREIPGSSERLLKVTYIGGYVTPNLTGTRDLPYDIEQACIETVCSLWRRRGVDNRAAAFDGQAAPVAVWGMIPGSAIPVLNRYRRVLP